MTSWEKTWPTVTRPKLDGEHVGDVVVPVAVAVQSPFTVALVPVAHQAHRPGRQTAHASPVATQTDTDIQAEGSSPLVTCKCLDVVLVTAMQTLATPKAGLGAGPWNSGRIMDLARTSRSSRGGVSMAITYASGTCPGKVVCTLITSSARRLMASTVSAYTNLQAIHTPRMTSSMHSLIRVTNSSTSSEKYANTNGKRACLQTLVSTGGGDLIGGEINGVM